MANDLTDSLFAPLQPQGLPPPQRVEHREFSVDSSTLSTA